MKSLSLIRTLVSAACRAGCTNVDEPPVRADLRCPNCGARQVRPAVKQGLSDQFLARFHIYPFRCRICQLRFHKRDVEGTASLTAGSG